MTRRHTPFLFAVLALLARPLAAQEPTLELDHVYIVVPTPAAPAIAALQRAGLTLDTAVNRHDGQGTASMAAFFENGYLELLWVDSTVPVDSDHVADHADFERASDWRRSGASPFGFGLHLLSGRAEDLPVPVTPLPAPHLGPGVFYYLLRQPGESLAADVFVMPARAAVPQWIERFRGRRPDLFAHALRVHRITGVTVRGPAANRPRALDLAIRPVRFQSDASQCVVLEFDNGREGREWDLRPALPLVLRQ